MKKICLIIAALFFFSSLSMGKDLLLEEVPDTVGEAQGSKKEEIKPVEKGKVFEERVFGWKGFVLAAGNSSGFYHSGSETRFASLQLNLQMDFKPSPLFYSHLDIQGKTSFSSDPSKNQNPKDVFLTHELYFSSQISFLNFSLGKKRLVIGSGMLVNPLDIFNPQKALPGLPEEREGQYLIGFNFSQLFENQSITAFSADFFYYPGIVKNKQTMLPEAIEKERQGFYSRIGGVFWKCDFSLYGFYKYEAFHYGISFSRYLTDSLEFHIESLFSNQRPVSLKRLFVDENKTLYLNQIIGIRYSFLSKLIVSLDYFYQQGGLTKNEFEADFSFQRKLFSLLILSLNSEEYEKNPFLTLKKHYLIVNLSWQDVSDYFNLNLTSFFSPEDQALLLFPKIDYLANDKSTAGFGVMLISGKKDHQYRNFSFEYQMVFDLTVYF
ncbi:MAG TPA: hypothetical protein DHW82_06720 [Spirochaetia bacterium]|nr:MAG: hypothetical protein A2Y41_11095 [Spirochaetes bacterium GWB1_36_13]HCL56687.1 hypothetical protein [Spirochaetia bacterium]